MLLTTPTEQHLVASSGVLLKFSQTTPCAFSMGFPQGKGAEKATKYNGDGAYNNFIT